MNLETLTLSEIEKMDLNGVKIVNLKCNPDSTDVSFEINDMQIDFIIPQSGDAEPTGLKHAGQTYSDPDTLAKCAEWVKYVATVVEQAMKRSRAELEAPIIAEPVSIAVTSATPVNEEEAPTATIEENPVADTTIPDNPVAEETIQNEEQSIESEVAVVSSIEEVAPVIEAPLIPTENVVTTPEPAIKDIISEPTPFMSAIIEDIDEAVSEVKIDEIAVPEAITTTDEIKPTPVDDLVEPEPVEEGIISNKRIEEAIERGRREGYTEARKMNLSEVKRIRKKCTIIVCITIALFIIGTFFLWILFGEAAGFPVPEFLNFFSEPEPYQYVPIQSLY